MSIEKKYPTDCFDETAEYARDVCNELSRIHVMFHEELSASSQDSRALLGATLLSTVQAIPNTTEIIQRMVTIARDYRQDLFEMEERIEELKDRYQKERRKGRK